MEIIVPAVIDSIARVSELMEEQTEAMGLPYRAQMQLNVILDELITNIASYGYPDGGGDIVVQMEQEPDAFRMTLIDRGIPYDPLAKADPDTTLSLEERPEGGLGIFMAKKLADRITYRRENGCNIVTFWKNK